MSRENYKNRPIFDVTGKELTEQEKEAAYNLTSNILDSIEAEDESKNSIFSNKNITIAAIGVSLVALGLAVYNASARSKLTKRVASFGKRMANYDGQIRGMSDVSGRLSSVENTVQSLNDGINNITTKANETMDTIKNKAVETMSGVLSAAQNKGNIISENVELNGNYFNLATMINPIDKGTGIGEKFVKELQTQATKNILGITENTGKKISGQPVYRIVSVELRPFTSVGGLSSVPKEIAEELPKILTKDTNARFMLDTPLYTGRIAVSNGNEIYGILRKEGENGDFVYELLNKKAKGISEKYNLKLIDSFETTLFNGEKETVRIFQHQVLSEEIPIEKIRGILSQNHINKIKKLAKNRTYETPNFIVKNVDGQKVFQRKVTYNLWDNEKFHLDTPLSTKPDIYTQKNYSSGLTEREILFNKYIYDQMVLMAENSSNPLRTDGLILNDWQTGPLAAMIRLNTIAKKYHGAINQNTYEKLKNMPIISLIHNNAYDGAIYNKAEVEKLFNVMFGQYASQIVPNAYMINTYNEAAKTGGINNSLINALMKNNGLCPLNMLVSYSDSVHPVSEGYARELLSLPELGKDFETIYRIRAKVNDNLQKLTEQALVDIAKASQLKVDASQIDKLKKVTYFGIDNGLNKQKNILDADTIKNLRDVLTASEAEKTFLVGKYGQSFATIQPESAIDFSSPQKVLNWKMNNKKAVLGYYVDSINEAKKTYSLDNSKYAGRLNTWVADLTDLTGVTENTPIFVTAGRIDDQKGYETFLDAIFKYITEYTQKGDDFPVFQIQGGMDVSDSKGYERKLLDKIINIKNELKDKGYKKAADRIVLLDKGGGGKYNISKLVADFNVMASKFEPCGLTHKEFLNMSGAIPIGHDTGGIAAQLEDGITGLFTPYRDSVDSSIKAKNLAELYKKAVDIFRDKNKYAKMVAAAKPLDFTWIQEGDCSGKKYLQAMENVGMILDSAT